MFRFVSALCATFIATSAVADVYECTTTRFGSDGWVGGKYILAFDRESKAGSVLDWAIAEVHEVPIPVDVIKRKETLWKFRYGVKGVRSAGGEVVGLRYSILLDTKKNTFRISGTLAGFENDISGSGTCKKIPV